MKKKDPIILELEREFLAVTLKCDRLQDELADTIAASLGIRAKLLAEITSLKEAVIVAEATCAALRLAVEEVQQTCEGDHWDERCHRTGVCDEKDGVALCTCEWFIKYGKCPECECRTVSDLLEAALSSAAGEQLLSELACAKSAAASNLALYMRAAKELDALKLERAK